MHFKKYNGSKVIPVVGALTSTGMVLEIKLAETLALKPIFCYIHSYRIKKKQ